MDYPKTHIVFNYTYFLVMVSLMHLMDNNILLYIRTHEVIPAPDLIFHWGSTKCIKLSKNSVNEKEPLEFNAQGRVCSPNMSIFANWCGILSRRRTNIPLKVRDWKNISKELVDYEAKLLTRVSVSMQLANWYICNN